MRLGLVGLPNVGKSTLFNAITSAGAAVANYPFCTIEPNVGMVVVPDDRLGGLARLYSPRKITPAVIEFVDIAGLVAGASQGEGLGNRFLANIRQVDALVHVVRCFSDPDVIHVAGHPDPLRDIALVNLELILADLEHLERRLEKTARLKKGKDQDFLVQLALYEKLLAHLALEKPARTCPLVKEEQAFLADLDLLTLKPVLYVANLAEVELGQTSVSVQQLEEYARQEDSSCVSISAKIEAEIAGLPPAERELFLAELGLGESGLNKIVRAGYKLLGLISFLTAGEPEVRAWTIRQGTRAPQAAGKIHSDLERGFIRAEVIPYPQLIACGSQLAAKEKGLVWSEGKDYIIQDGDVVHFRFNV